MRVPEIPFTALSDPAQQRMAIGYLQQVSELPFIVAAKKHAVNSLNIQPNQTIVDIGSGLGRDVVTMARRVGDGVVIGVDASEHMVQFAIDSNNKVPDSNYTFIVGVAESLPLPDESVDGVKIERVLQHLADPSRAIGEAHRILRPGGRIVLTETNWNSLLLDTEAGNTNSDFTTRALEIFKARQRYLHIDLATLLSGSFTDIDTMDITFRTQELAEFMSVVKLETVRDEMGPEVYDFWHQTMQSESDRGLLQGALTMQITSASKF